MLKSLLCASCAALVLAAASLPARAQYADEYQYSFSYTPATPYPVVVCVTGLFGPYNEERWYSQPFRSDPCRYYGNRFIFDGRGYGPRYHDHDRRGYPGHDRDRDGHRR